MNWNTTEEGKDLRRVVVMPPQKRAVRQCLVKAEVTTQEKIGLMTLSPNSPESNTARVSSEPFDGQ